MMQERMGQFEDAVFDYTAALPLLRVKGEIMVDSIFNRGYCYRQERGFPLTSVRVAATSKKTSVNDFVCYWAALLKAGKSLDCYELVQGSLLSPRNYL
jgi:hypothetical protein